MNRRKKWMFLGVMISLMLMLSVTASAKISISKKSISLLVGKTYTLKMKGTKEKVKWSSANKSVASVSSKGKVTAVYGGKTTSIRAKVGKKTYTCKVKVKSYTTAQVQKALENYYKKEMANQGGVAWITETKKATGTYSYYTARYGTGAKRDYKINRKTGKVYGAGWYFIYGDYMEGNSSYKYAFNLSKYI